MDISTMKKIIQLLKDKKIIALRDRITYPGGERIVQSHYYQEYKSLFSSLIFEVSKQRPTYAIQYSELTKSEMNYD
jgi:hypothetical protein